MLWMMLRRGRILVLVFLLLRGVDRFKRYYEVVKEIDGARYVLEGGLWFLILDVLKLCRWLLDCLKGLM